jgi:Tol biopolymer transport system component
MHMMIRAVVLLGVFLAAGAALAERQPVLQQIDLPHPYYYREMYLPQLTSGPSSVAWSPDSKELIYSMAGSLWRQVLASPGPPAVAQQLTAALAYDYQPDWSPDGRWVVYSSYQGAAVELWLLDLSTGATQALTHNGGVNVEARFSPDGERIAFVSTQYHRRFHIFTATFRDGQLQDLRRLTGEHKSTLPRYYYSAFDHELSPVWTRDGKSILFVSNRDRIYGTGGFWRIAADAGVAPEADTEAASHAQPVHDEETNWKARPDVSPDGTRLVYSSYLGRSWHNLWMLPAQGGDAFPIGYADWDQTNPRWSPDGTRVAFIANRTGTTQIGVLKVPGGHVEYVHIAERRFRSPMTRLRLDIKDASGGPGTARVSITDAAGRFYAPRDAWVHADDGIDLKLHPFEAHYFHAHAAQWVDVPVGGIHVEVLHGFERGFQTLEVPTRAGQTAKLEVNLGEGAWDVPDEHHWVSADVHVHMNYGGVYRNTPANLARQAQGEHLGFVNALIVNKEQRFPDIEHNGVGRDPYSLPDTLIVHSQEYHTSYWGHLGLLNIQDGVILPGYAGYPNTAAASLFPMNADVADIAHARGALVGYVHPFDEYPEPIAKPHQVLTSELPVDVALGKVDYMEILGFSDHRSTARVWYQLLNLGFHIPAAGGTDAMANFASLRGPVGMNRVFARVPEGDIRADSWFDALKRGRTFATNGPLLGFSLDEAQIGDTLNAAAPKTVTYSVRLQSIVPVDHLELVCNGRVVESLAHRVDQGEYKGSLPLKDSGWCVVRASTDAARYPVLDNYVYATTSPIYIEIEGRPVKSPQDARYFAAWIDRMMETTAAYPDWNSATEKEGVMQRLKDAQAIFVAME